MLCSPVGEPLASPRRASDDAEGDTRHASHALLPSAFAPFRRTPLCSRFGRICSASSLPRQLLTREEPNHCEHRRAKFPSRLCESFLFVVFADLRTEPPVAALSTLQRVQHDWYSRVDDGLLPDCRLKHTPASATRRPVHPGIPLTNTPVHCRLRCPSLVAAAIFFHPPAATVRDEDLGLASPAESTTPTAIVNCTRPSSCSDRPTIPTRA